MLIRPAIGDTDPIRYRRPNPDGQFSGNILDEAMRREHARRVRRLHIQIVVEDRQFEARHWQARGARLHRML